MESYDSDISQITLGGETLGLQRYTVVKLLHESASGAFMLYRSNRMGKWVVLKALKPEYRGDPFYETILQKEFQLGYNLRHSGVVETIDYVTLPETGNAIVLEYIDGITLRQYLDEIDVLSREEAMSIIDEMCKAVAYLHSHKIIHRDLKPENIMVEHATRAVKIIDLGCADASDYNILKGPAGTRHYAAPEQLEQGAVVDVRTDIYAIGKIIESIVEKTGKSWHNMSNVIQKCCAVNPDERYASMQELRDVLEKKTKRSRLILLLPALIVIVLGVMLVQRSNEVETTPMSPQIIGTESAPNEVDTFANQKSKPVDIIQNNTAKVSDMYNSLGKKIRTNGLAEIKQIYKKFETAEIDAPSEHIESACNRYLKEARDSLSKYINGEELEEKIRNLRSIYYGIHYDYVTKNRNRILEKHIEFIREKSATLSPTKK